LIEKALCSNLPDVGPHDEPIKGWQILML